MAVSATLVSATSKIGGSGMLGSAGMLEFNKEDAALMVLVIFKRASDTPGILTLLVLTVNPRSGRTGASGVMASRLTGATIVSSDSVMAWVTFSMASVTGSRALLMVVDETSPAYAHDSTMARKSERVNITLKRSVPLTPQCRLISPRVKPGAA